ncbi:unnamed protein product [Peniophora sp. CBMAI 1063]|nr:unnamed protein product [Peniophora sp. CBMAI 1063]
MRFSRPAWVMHKDAGSKDTENPKRLSIFSVHVHPDGSRIATGGLDAKIRIWSTKPILNPASDASNKPPKSLSTLTMHTGPVLCVRWAHNGRWLASGSDDEIVMVWDLDPHARGKVWGSDEVNVEGWKPLKRLPGHESDVTDVAWSPEDRYLASVGLDSAVMIWDGFTLERVRKLDQHQGFVKGVCWDPVGEYLATQSDDRTVKIWRTTDWQLEAEVRKPFEDSPGSTFFRRLSWSPDGAHITASNATNNNGFVFIAAVIARNSWTSEISLVGHENTVEVAAYNPHIFLRNPAQPLQTSNICSVVALGADDCSVSIWQTKSARPLVVAKRVFERQILDLAWSNDGLVLYAVSSDGTLAAFAFDAHELEGLAPIEAQKQYLTKFGFELPDLPAGYSHTQTPPPSNSATPVPTVNANGGEVVNTLVAKRNVKKRVSLARPGDRFADVPSAAFPKNHQTEPPVNDSPFNAPFSDRDADIDMFPPTFNDRRKSGAVAGPSKAASTPVKVEIFPVKGRTLGGERPIPSEPDRLRTVHPPNKPLHPPSGVNVITFDIPGALNFISHTVAEPGATLDNAVLEAHNSETGGINEVIYLVDKKIQWLDYLATPIILLTASPSFCCAATIDARIHVYSPAGRKLIPTLTLDSPAAFLCTAKSALVILTSAGTLHSIDTETGEANFTPVSVNPLLSKDISLLSLGSRANGSPVLVTSQGVAHAYDPKLKSFVIVSETWFAKGSDVWIGPTKPSMAPGTALAAIEATLANGMKKNERGREKHTEWWDTVVTLRHLEARIHAATVIDSGKELRTALQQYAKLVAEQGFAAKAEEVVNELFGPIYRQQGVKSNFKPVIALQRRRDMLKEVIQIFAQSPVLQDKVKEWKELFKKTASPGDDVDFD